MHRPGTPAREPEAQIDGVVACAEALAADLASGRINAAVFESQVQALWHAWLRGTGDEADLVRQLIRKVVDLQAGRIDHDDFESAIRGLWSQWLQGSKER